MKSAPEISKHLRLLPLVLRSRRIDTPTPEWKELGRRVGIQLTLRPQRTPGAFIVENKKWSLAREASVPIQFGEFEVVVRVPDEYLVFHPALHRNRDPFE